MLTSELDERSQVETWLRQVENVKEVYSVYGCYDILVKIETEDLDEMNEVISNNISRIPNVGSTITLRVVE
jgi:DNA-binding Lrp family transcriptional regulator